MKDSKNEEASDQMRGEKSKKEYVPTGKPRGRPPRSVKIGKRGAHLRVPDDLKKPKTKKVYVPTGKPRGRPPKADADKKVYKPTGKPRGRPRKEVKE